MTLTHLDRGSGLLQDWSANSSGKSKVIMVLMRVAQEAHRRGGLLGKVVVGVYKVLTTWILGVEIPPETQIGAGCKLLHPVAIVINGEARIGSGVTIRNSVTIGNVVGKDGLVSASPVIGDDVELGAGCLVLGAITVGAAARVGAGAVVVKDVEAGATVVGNPARPIGPSR